MRILIKGGVWKNSEDEILKAAIMKYGLNHWDRVASLIVRKTPSQCKARWFEWLDPAIKKTEWSRDEEEKLLHLAKIFPAQWRTIAPIVGRTAHQCIEHYERLLDQAAGRKPAEEEDDPRRLRPGEIDVAPETRPARADPMDMDDDEKEMLQEARARLANVHGKKAKRKAREKVLDDSKRLATLQKNREMKAAGLSVNVRRPGPGEIDYAKEIPFETRPIAGAHATGEDEDPRPKLDMQHLSLQILEGKNRRAEELRNRKDDARKLKKINEKNLPAVIEKDLADFEKKFSTLLKSLNLPAPLHTSEKLAEIALLGNSTPLSATRTPLEASDGVRRAAAEAAARAALPTPLLADGESPAEVKAEVKEKVKAAKQHAPQVGDALRTLPQARDAVQLVKRARIEAHAGNLSVAEFVREGPSLVMSRNLPRPASVHLVDLWKKSENLIAKEAIGLAIRDAVQRPIRGIRPPGLSDIPAEATETFLESELRRAEAVITAEAMNIPVGEVIWPATAEPDYNALKSAVEKEAQKVDATAKKIDAINGGQQNICASLTTEISKLSEDLEISERELRSSQAAAVAEDAAAARRIGEWQNRVSVEKRRNKELNDRFSKLTDLKRKLSSL